MLLLKQPPTNDTQDHKDVARYAVDPLGRALGLVPFVVNAVKAEAVRARVCSVTRLGGSKCQPRVRTQARDWLDVQSWFTHTALVVLVLRNLRS